MSDTLMLAAMGRHILFKCPQTGLKVQAWLEDPPENEARDSYQGMDCPACTLVHYVHRVSGKLLGEQGDQARPRLPEGHFISICSDVTARKRSISPSFSARSNTSSNRLEGLLGNGSFSFNRCLSVLPTLT